MDMNEKDKFGLEKSGDHSNHHSPGMSSDWQFSNSSVGLLPANPALCQVTQMRQSFSPSHWNSYTTSRNPGFCDNGVESNAAASDSLYIGKPVPRPPRPDLGWSSSDSTLKGGVFRQTVPGVLPPSLSHFRADSAFIERAARFSCFNGDNLSSMVNPFSATESLSPYSTSLKGSSGGRALESDVKMQESLKDDASLANDHGSGSVSPMEVKRDKNHLHCVSVSANELRKTDTSRDGQEEAPNLRNAAGESCSKDLAANKRKRTDQDVELDQRQGAHQMSVETTNENTDSEQEAEQNNSTIATVKPNGKQAKGSSDAPKEEYIHMRARRGQATNSHSLAERVRREKISERMKYLQDLVPGCSKVTGKAVMLDEIINYVQSLQRQVEFLSMKLATVNPRLDLNIDALLSKDLLQSRGGPSAVGFSADMLHHQLHPFQQGLVQAGMPGMINNPDALRRAIQAQVTTMNEFKESMPQMANLWDQDLHNVAQFQELNGKPHNGFP